MSLPISEAFEIAFKILEFKENDHKAFISDLHTIANKIHHKVILEGSIFKDMFKDLYKTAHYRKGSFFDMPDQFCSHLMLEVPFKDIDYCFSPPHFVKFKTNHAYPLVYDGYIDAFVFALKFHDLLVKVISELPPILCNGDRIYLLSLDNDNHKGILDWPRIVAKEQFCVDGHPAEIIFHFLPILKFPINSKYCVLTRKISKAYWTCASPFPEQIDHRNRFRQFIPIYQQMKYLDMMKARKVLILLDALLTHGKLSQISPVVENFIFKNIYLELVQEKNVKYMKENDLATVLLDVLWKIKCHVLYYEFPGRKNVHNKLEEFCRKLIALKVVSVIPIKSVLKFFGLM